MGANLDRIIRQLRTITRLAKEHTWETKINTTTGALEPTSLRTSVCRYFRDDSRAKTLTMIQTSYAEAQDYLWLTRNAREGDEEVLRDRESLLSHMESSLKGVDELKITYKSDAAFTEELELEQEKVLRILNAP